MSQLLEQSFRWLRLLAIGCLLLGIGSWIETWAVGQEPPITPPPVENGSPEEQVEPLPEQVAVDEAEMASDDDIAERLRNILKTTDWFGTPNVQVKEGIVFLSGQADTEAHREWATQLARRTEDVVAVVNHLTVQPRDIWDLTPAWRELDQMFRTTVVNLPLLGVAVLLLIVTIFLMRITYRLSHGYYSRSLESRLLGDVAARMTAGLVLVFGVYFVLRISGQTRLAATIVGGTGLVGIVVGFAFRDIAENFLASVLISLHRPFRIDDLIEVDGVTGFVRSVTTRGTMLQTFSGNHVHISNSTIYKSRLTNFTSNPSTRDVLNLGIGYDAPVAKAQDLIHDQLKEHPAVLDDPASLVLVDNLGSATINLKIYFWVNTRNHSLLKVRSSLLRHIVAALAEGNISMPDEAREIIFPQGVDIRTTGELFYGPPERDQPTPSSPAKRPIPEDPDSLEDATEAEGELTQEKAELDRQEAHTEMPSTGPRIM